MRLTEEPFTVATGAYRLTCLSDRPYLRLETPSGAQVADLFVPSSAHRLGALDDTPELSPWQAERRDDEVVLWLEAKSSAWAKKTYRLRCSEERFSYECELEGTGQLTEVQYFGGYLSARPRWGSGFFWSAQAFAAGFNPEPYVDERYAFAPREGSLIDLTGVPIAGKDGWFFTPPPYAFAFETEAGWLALGLAAAPGENRYTDFRYQGHRSAFHLSLAFEGRTKVDGRYRLPAITFDFAAEPYAALADYAEGLRAQQLAPTPAPGAAPAWWQEPIFCGWGSQCALAARAAGRAPDYATQENYQAFLAALEAQDITPGTVVIDDKWQASYGGNEVDREKWPDLPGFIAAQHDAGRKVLLWLKAWDPEGLPHELCVTNAAGAPVALDVTHPEFEARFRAAIHRMLASEGYGADGFKLDFTARIPSGPALASHGDAWGLELMKRYLGILYSEAKAAKPDALLMTHTPHPYLADVLDMIRLNDINTGADVLAAMRHRARVARLACPQALVDTDNWPVPNKAAWREYLALQPELGVPSLYFATHIDATGEALDEADYRLVRETWARYRAEQGLTR